MCFCNKIFLSWDLWCLLARELNKNIFVARDAGNLGPPCSKLSGHVHRHNCVYWTDKNPIFAIKTQLHQHGVCILGRII